LLACANNDLERRADWQGAEIRHSRIPFRSFRQICCLLHSIISADTRTENQELRTGHSYPNASVCEAFGIDRVRSQVRDLCAQLARLRRTYASLCYFKPFIDIFTEKILDNDLIQR